MPYNGERDREIEERDKKKRQGEEEKKEEVAEAAVTRRARGHVYFSKTLVIRGEKIVKSGLSRREPSEHRKPTVVQSSREEESFVGIQCCRETGKIKY